MFSYSKRLALLLTVCGTLLNTSPLLAAKDSETTNQSSKSSWFKPWTWGKKKDNKPKETKEDLLQQVNKRLASIDKLTKEFAKEDEQLEGTLKQELDANKRKTLRERSFYVKKTREELITWKKKLDFDQWSLNRKALPDDALPEIRQNIKASGNFINKIYGYKRRVKSWFGKKLSRTKNTTQPAEQDPSSVPTPAQNVSTTKESEDIFEDATENLQQ